MKHRRIEPRAVHDWLFKLASASVILALVWRGIRSMGSL